MSRGGGLLLVMALQAALVARLVSWSDAVERPFGMVDYPVHFMEALRASEHLRRTGALWGWSPEWMAGFPEGVLGLVDNKLFFVIVALVPQGFEIAAFNFGVLGAIFATPLLLFAAARARGAGAAETVAAAIAAVVVTFAVPIGTAFWQAGIISFFLASAASVPALVALARRLEDGRLFSRDGVIALLAALFAAFVHPGAYFVLAPGLFAVVALRRPTKPRVWLELVAIGLVVVLPTLPVAFAARHLGPYYLPTPPNSFPDGGVSRLLDDWLWSIWGSQPDWGGAGAMIGLGVLALAGIRSLGRRGVAPETIALAVAATTCFFLAYAGSSIRALKLLQPYRFLVPFAFLLCLPAARGAVALFSVRRPATIVTAALALVLILKSTIVVAPKASVGSGVDPTERELARALAERTAPDDRILVQGQWRGVPPFPGSARKIWIYRFRLLSLDVSREFLGHGSFAPATVYSYANFSASSLFRVPLKWFSSAERVRAALDRYGISWVVVASADTLAWARRFPAVFESTGRVGDVEIFRVRDPVRSRFLEGSGSVHAELDRIEVRNASGERLVLRYHWLPTWRTIPPLRIEEVRLPGAPVGFIGVHPEGRRDFVIVNGGDA